MQFIIQKALFRLKPVLFFLLSGISPCCFLTGNASPLKANLFTNCSIDSFVVVNPLCNAICSGEIQVFAQGSGTLFYQWPQIPGAGSAMVSGLCAGTYSVIITDSAGCISIDSVTISEPPPILFDLLTTTTTCPGACSGSVSVIPFDTIPYIFSWPGFVSSSPILGGLCTGSYTVIVTDPQGCSAIGSASVLYDPPFQLSFSTVAATCVSFCDGTATVTASGSGPFIYQWQTGPIQSTATATGLCQGPYSVFVTDSNGCVVSDTVRIGLIPSPLTSSVLIEPSCFGSCDGTAEVVVSLPGNYSYQWNTNPIQDSSVATGLCASMYMVQVTELTIGCVFIDSVEVLNPEPTLLSFTTTSSECVNFCSGSASVQSSGPAPFIYLWQNGATSSFIDSICPGIYEVTVTDSLGCASTGSVEVVAREVLFNTVNASCNNLCNGEAEVILPSGSWQINWNTIPVQNTTVISGLCGGSYSILMVDSSGCILSDSIEILIEQPILSNILTQPVTCLSACDGAVSVSAVGNGPFSFTWNTNPVQLTDSLFQLCEGVYLVTIVDSLGCSKIDTAVVIGPDTLTFSFTSMVNSCTGVCDASAVIFPSAPGGYIYKWFTSPIQYGAAAFGLCPDYTLVEITTSAGCIYFDSVLVIDPNPVFVVMNSDAITCAGDCDGSVGCVALGGNPGYTYEWSIGISSPQVFNLCPGMYTVTVTDASGCTKQNSIELIEPDSIFISFAVTDASCISCSDGSITATVTGGVRDYSYFWNSGSSADSIISSILPGIYQLCVSDFNSCLYCQSTTVSFLNSVANLGLETINVSLFPNPFSDKAVLQILGLFKNDSDILQLEILDLSCRKINSVEIENFTRNANHPGFVLTNHGTAPGIYFYRLIAENRVLQSGKIVIAPK